MTPVLPPLRWHGGKWRLVPWIIGHFPQHRFYVEPFGGGASVLLRKLRSYAEVYNDLDEQVVNLFRVLQDDTLAERLVAALELTPFARSEYEIGWDETDEPVKMERDRLLHDLHMMAIRQNELERELLSALRSAGRAALEREGRE